MMFMIQVGNDVAAGVSVPRGKIELEKGIAKKTGHMEVRLGEKVHVRRMEVERGMTITTVIRQGRGRKIVGEMISDWLSSSSRLPDD